MVGVANEVGEMEEDFLVMFQRFDEAKVVLFE